MEFYSGDTNTLFLSPLQWTDIDIYADVTAGRVDKECLVLNSKIYYSAAEDFQLTQFVSSNWEELGVNTQPLILG